MYGEKTNMRLIDPDFWVDFNPDVDNLETLSKRIVTNIFERRIKSNKATTFFICGKSGSGKSATALKIEECILEAYGLSLKDYLHEINVYTPLQYPEKLDKLLHDKTLKKLHVMATHEARTLIRASKWRSFLNEAVGDVNAMSRSVKKMVFILISQFVKDISSNVRYTIDYYCKIRRPIRGNVQMKIYSIYQDDRDLEKPKMKKRALIGVIKTPKGHKVYKPKYIELKMIDKEVFKMFDEEDTKHKSLVLRKKFDRLIKEMKMDMGVNDKLDAIVEFYVKNPDQLQLMGRVVRNKWKMNKEFKVAHDLTKEEELLFISKISEKLKENGRMANVETEDEFYEEGDEEKEEEES